MLRLNNKTMKFFQKIILLIFFLVVGIVLTNQYLLYRQISSIQKGSDASSMVTRLSQLYNDNEKLKVQLNERTAHLSELENAVSSSADTQKLLEDEINKYEIISGKKEVEGPGIEVLISHQMALTQLVDFLNALRNSGAEATSINDARVITNTPMSKFENKSSYIFKIIGDKDILYESLTRPGGVFDVIINGEAQKMDNLSLPKASI